MQISIVYATYSNSTALASEHLSQALTAAGHSVTMQTATGATSESLQQPELLILASPSWDYNGQQGMPHEDFLTMQQTVGEISLQAKPAAVMALGDSSFTYYCGAAGHLSTWLAEKGAKELVAPLKIDQYYANEIAAQEQIAAWSKQIVEALAKTPTA